MSVPYIVLLDLDDTVFKAAWRDRFKPCADGVTVAPRLWDTYNSESIHDSVITEMVELVRLLKRSGYEIWAVTSRPEKWRSMTRAKCHEEGIPVDTLLMRPDDETGIRSPLLKPALVVEALVARHGPGDSSLIHRHVAFCIDDRADVAESFRALGVVVLQVHADQERVR